VLYAYALQSKQRDVNANSGAIWQSLVHYEHYLK